MIIKIGYFIYILLAMQVTSMIFIIFNLKTISIKVNMNILVKVAEFPKLTSNTVTYLFNLDYTYTSQM